MDAITMELISNLMRENLELRNEISDLKSKIVPEKQVKSKKIKENKKKYGKLSDEDLAAKRRENGLRLAEWRKLKKENSENSEKSEVSEEDSLV